MRIENSVPKSNPRDGIFNSHKIVIFLIILCMRTANARLHRFVLVFSNRQRRTYTFHMVSLIFYVIIIIILKGAEMLLFPILYMQTTKALVRLRDCAGSSESSLGTYITFSCGLAHFLCFYYYYYERRNSQAMNLQLPSEKCAFDQLNLISG